MSKKTFKAANWKHWIYSIAIAIVLGAGVVTPATTSAKCAIEIQDKCVDITASWSS